MGEYILYSVNRDKWNPNNLSSAYYQYFMQKMKLVQISLKKQELEQMTKAQKTCAFVNGTKIMISEEEIAIAAQQKIKSSREDINTLYAKTIQAMQQSGEQFDEAYQTAAVKLLANIQSGNMNGMQFTMDLNSSTALDLEQAAQSSIYKRGSLSNTLGDIGEGVSGLAGQAIAEAFIENFEQQLPNSIVPGTVKATYTNKGGVYHGAYRSQTDNQLNISFQVYPNIKGGNVATLNFTYNISDKANQKLAVFTDKTRATGWLNIRNSTVGAQMHGLAKSAVYNTISYHRDKDDNLVPGMRSPAGEALQDYLGYKMLYDTLIMSKQYMDSINFTVYGNRIIPESTIATKMLSSKSDGKSRYSARLRYWELIKEENGILKSAVQSVEEAQNVINKMKVNIGESFYVGY